MQPPEPVDPTARYVLACAAITASSQFLIAAHAAVGPPKETTDPVGQELRRAVAKARAGAGAMAVVAGRLLTRVRQDEARALGDPIPPVAAETGIATPGLPVKTAWRTTMRGLASAAAECSAALEALQQCGASDRLCRPIGDLVRISAMMADLEPSNQPQSPAPSVRM